MIINYEVLAAKYKATLEAIQQVPCNSIADARTMRAIAKNAVQGK